MQIYIITMNDSWNPLKEKQMLPLLIHHKWHILVPVTKCGRSRGWRHDQICSLGLHWPNMSIFCELHDPEDPVPLYTFSLGGAVDVIYGVWVDCVGVGCRVHSGWHGSALLDDVIDNEYIHYGTLFLNKRLVTAHFFCDWVVILCNPN